MKSVYDFIVKPIGDRYANTKKIGDHYDKEMARYYFTQWLF